MTDRDIDQILERSTGDPHPLDPALVERIAISIRPDGPVRPLPPVWALASGLLLICGIEALAAAACLGLYGIRKLSATETALIFPALGVFTWIAALSSVGEMTPGRRRPAAPAWILALGSLSLVSVFALLFRDYGFEGFVHQGLPCLTAGVLCAVPAGAAIWLVIRRGYAVHPVAAGLATGTLASLAGVAMLELHCPNLQALHVIVWHTAVILVSALAAALLVWAVRVMSDVRTH